MYIYATYDEHDYLLIIVITWPYIKVKTIAKSYKQIYQFEVAVPFL